MPVYKIPDISARAKTRIGRVEQIRALAPFPDRHDGNHWALNRVAWVHPRIPGRADLLLGKDNAALARAREALADAGASGEVVDALTLDELVITPDLISGGPQGFNIQTNIAEPPRGTASSNLQPFEPSGQRDFIAVTAFGLQLTTRQMYASASVSAPIVVEGISIVGQHQVPSDTFMNVVLNGVGWSHEILPGGLGNDSADTTYIPLGRWITSGAVSILIDVHGTPTDNPSCAVTATLNYQHLRPRA